MKTCVVCGKKFEGHGNAKYCSKKCYKIERRKQKKKWYKNNKEKVMDYRREYRHKKASEGWNKYRASNKRTRWKREIKELYGIDFEFDYSTKELYEYIRDLALKKGFNLLNYGCWVIDHKINYHRFGSNVTLKKLKESQKLKNLDVKTKNEHELRHGHYLWLE